jgi:mRNA-degrading endonuclease RelE of RelBE toxin-antitoxin system
MAYQVKIAKIVQKQLNNLPDDIYNRVMGDIVLLPNNPRPLFLVAFVVLKWDHYSKSKKIFSFKSITFGQYTHIRQ